MQEKQYDGGEALTDSATLEQNESSIAMAANI